MTAISQLSDERNLWPESHRNSFKKDGLENSLNQRVCSGKITLANARRPRPCAAFSIVARTPQASCSRSRSNEDLAGVMATMRQNPQHGTGFLGLGPVSAQLARENGHPDEITSWWSYHRLQKIWEWKTESRSRGPTRSARRRSSL